MGWDGAEARACARWPVTAEPFAAKILTVSTSASVTAASQPCPLLLAGDSRDRDDRTEMRGQG